MNYRLSTLTLICSIVALSICAPAEARPRRTRASVPLIPEQSAAVAATPSPYTTLPRIVSPEEESGEKWRFGFGLGALGRSQQTNTSALGVDVFLGARASVWIPIGSQFKLVPSLGGFFRTEGNGAVSVSEYRVEAGLNLLYTLVAQDGWSFAIGGAQRVDMQISRISAWNAAANSNPVFLYRVGPSVYADVKLGSSLYLYGEAETTFSVLNPVRVYPAVFMGLQIPIGP